MNVDYVELRMPIVEMDSYSQEVIDAMKEVERAERAGLPVEDEVPWPEPEPASRMHWIFNVQNDDSFWICSPYHHRLWRENNIDLLIEEIGSDLRRIATKKGKDFLARGFHVLAEVQSQLVHVNKIERVLLDSVADGGDEDDIEKLAFLLDTYRSLYKAASRVAGGYIDATLLLQETRRGF